MESVQFGVIADVQYAQTEPAMGRYYRLSLGKLAESVTYLNQQDVAFVIQLGDIIDGGTSAERELTDVVEVYGQLKQPAYHVLGNHDFNGIERTTTMDILNMDGGYYWFDVGQWRFVVLDTQDLAIQGGWKTDGEKYQQAKTMLSTLRADGVRNAQDYNGGIGPQQKHWLAETLDQADADRKHVIVFGHLPLMDIGETHTLWNADEIAALLDQYECVKAYFNGHRHSGGYTKRNGIHYVTIEAIVDAADADGAWAVVTLSDNEIIIEGFGAVPSRTLEIN